MIRLFCDLCNEELKDENDYTSVYISNQHGDRIFQELRYDLCPNCLEALRQTLRTEKKFNKTTDVNKS
jgi:hypothetical protein